MMADYEIPDWLFKDYPVDSPEWRCEPEELEAYPSVATR